ncbi:Plasmodium variant antigen protein Cir/Yir/Bir, putative [Plasmodium chabaudi adami]|uniref:Plasmodium variant antigen protein Cir/Yir/Bir, putative n=1 Tax=Plasmodium chabaudi adami TaxID=5826 RepID=A0A1D3LAE1_PLACE|nr:Plasmodium variant antigen protein Cir/Yir/Bir, putative [Plasmodium chabaudi adami]
MSKGVCKVFKEIDELFKWEKNGSNINIVYDDSLKAYCPVVNYQNKKECVSYEQIISSAFTILLKDFKNVYDDDDGGVLEDDKLADYAILWLSYKIIQKLHSKVINLKEYYDKYLKKNNKYIEGNSDAEAYKTCNDIINKKQDLMNIDIQIISKFYEALQILCNMYNEDKEKNPDCAKCSKKANEFVEIFKGLNDNSNHTDGSSYNQLLHILSNDYDNFKNCCNKKKGESCDFPSLPKITPKKRSVQNPVESPGHKYGQTSEDISSKSPIANTLIPVLSIFVAIPMFLGIAYKYSLFGIDKRLQRQHLRKKLKKIKKKMNNHYLDLVNNIKSYI